VIGKGGGLYLWAGQRGRGWLGFVGAVSRRGRKSFPSLKEIEELSTGRVPNSGGVKLEIEI